MRGRRGDDPDVLGRWLASQRPDTLKGGDRQGLMEIIQYLGGDTTDTGLFNQGDIARVLDSTLLDSLVSSMPYEVQGRHRRPDAPPSVDLYAERNSRRGYFDRGANEIRLNAASSFYPDLSTNVASSDGQKAMSPGDRLRQVLIHEVGHWQGYDDTTAGLASTSPTGLNPTDLYAAAFDGISQTSSDPDATMSDVVQAAVDSYEQNTNLYKERGRAGRVPQAYRDDLEEVMRKTFIPFMLKDHGAFADHPSLQNTTSKRILRGIGSLLRLPFRGGGE